MMATTESTDPQGAPAALFSPDWMARFAQEWNKEPELSQALSKIHFTSTVAYGFVEEKHPAGVLVVKDGVAVSSGPYDEGMVLNWDLRATSKQWLKWMTQKPPGVAGLGIAATTGKIKFRTGNYSAMLKDPRMAGPFVKSFSVMGRVQNA